VKGDLSALENPDAIEKIQALLGLPAAPGSQD
jgi:hypothetical protein